MSDQEDDIWGYKSNRKRRASGRNGDVTVSQEEGRKAGGQGKRRGDGRTGASRKTKNPRKRKKADTSPDPAREQNKPAKHGADSPGEVLTTPTRQPNPTTPQARHSGYCPSCQMPFSILLVQTPRWHVSECLDTVAAAQTECPDGMRCSSTIASHYKRFSHFLLAHSRAGDQSLFSPPPSPYCPSSQAGESNISNDKRHSHRSPAFINSNTTPKSRSPTSSQDSVKWISLDAWLSPSKRAENSAALSQERPSRSTPSRVRSARPSRQGADSDRTISFSPLVSDQELFSDGEESSCSVKGQIPRKLSASSGNNVSRRLLATYDCHNNINETVTTPPKQANNIDDSNAVSSVTGVSTCASDQAGTANCTEQGNWSECSTPGSEPWGWDLTQLDPECWIDEESDNINPDSFTQTQGLSLAAEVCEEEEIIHTSEQTQHPHTANSGPPAAWAEETSTQSSQVMSASAKAMKQMDIGVFFGLKPKAKAEVKVPLKSQSPNAIAPQSQKPVRKRKAKGSLGDGGSLADYPSEVSAAAATGTQKRWGKRFQQDSTAEEGRGKKQCPFYKKIPGTGFVVDAFQYGQIEGCSAYFLTHFHSDHYGGLTKKFRFPIYCSKITGNLVESKLRVEKQFINTLPMNTECVVDNVRVILLEANHCPGAVLLLFILPNGTKVLHTGDFRAEPSMERYPALIGQKIHTLYLDTTYCSPEYTFPPQQEAVQFAVNAAFETMTLYPRTLVVCGTYSIGKERVFLAIADVLGCKVCMSQDKYKTMQCLESAEISSLVTTDWHSTALHVLPMMQVNFKGLNAHLNKFSGKYDRVLAFKPTGWTYSEGCGSVADIRPDVRGKVTIYGVPYSEHSSYLEMKRFVQFVKPQKIIPTVNVGNWKSRTAMEKYFAEWLSEVRSK
ncbi:DNA cross-link repair 1A protein [Pseudophryne corroboree]|uniref:DNA cross-link repair 1A protein n=1 Tax=Pseudophryne corroboree TaxID=495146 RepID=UPI003081F52B